MADNAVAVVGLIGGEAFGAVARDALARAEVVVGSERQRRSLRTISKAQFVSLAGPLPPVVDQIEAAADQAKRVVVLASGDPGFFGITRALRDRLGDGAVVAYPAPSSVAVAFGRLGDSWDDAIVVSAHGRPLADAVHAIGTAHKVAVLTSPSSPPQAVGAAVLQTRPDLNDVAVFARIGESEEQIAHTDLAGLAAGEFDPMAVVVLRARTDRSGPNMQVAWAPSAARFGQPVDAFSHRSGMITKPEVRAVALATLALPPTGVLWDIGAGSGSVGIEAASLSPSLRVLAVERDTDQAAHVRANATAYGVRIEVVEGTAPDAFVSLPDPDRVFVGGGGIDVLRAVLARLRPGGIVVATYALIDRAVEAHAILGTLVQIAVTRGKPIEGVGLRMHAEHPVFVAWGPA